MAGIHAGGRCRLADVGVWRPGPKIARRKQNGVMHGTEYMDVREHDYASWCSAAALSAGSASPVQESRPARRCSTDIKNL